MNKSDLHMNEPVWVWLYDYGPHTIPQAWEPDTDVVAYPQAHTYAFRSQADALAHPAMMGWAKDHKYVLQKVYLNGEYQKDAYSADPENGFAVVLKRNADGEVYADETGDLAREVVHGDVKVVFDAC